MTHIANKPIPKLPNALQLPLSHLGATPASVRAKKPPLAELPAPAKELNLGDRIMGLGDFGKPTGEIGRVEQANEDDAIVKRDEDGRVRVPQEQGLPSIHDLVNKLAVIVGHCDLLGDYLKAGSEGAKRVGAIHDIARGIAKELTEHQRQLSESNRSTTLQKWESVKQSSLWEREFAPSGKVLGRASRISGHD